MPQREEFITKAILKYLNLKGWTILAFDYPQSGTGISLHPIRRVDHTKNLGMITPDVIAIKNKLLLILEDKPGFYESDVEKLKTIKAGEYSESIRSIFGISDFNIMVGIGIGDSPQQRKRALCRTDTLDVILWVDKNGDTHEAYTNFKL